MFCHQLFALSGCVSNIECRLGVLARVARVAWCRVSPGCVPDDKPVLWLGDGTGKVTVLLTLIVVVIFATMKIPPSLSLSLLTASGVIKPFRRVN